MKKYMTIAYQEALKAYKRKEIPVGAVIVKKDKIISKARNNRQNAYKLLGHAEINCILSAEKKLKDWRLDGCDMYVTLEPCKMCKMFIKESRLNRIYYLLPQSKTDSEEEFVQTNDCDEIKDKYKKILKEFFSELRE